MRVLYLVPLFFICWLSMIVLALAVFRQRLKEYRKQIVVSAVVLTLISVFVQTTHSVIGLILQPLFVILCFYMIFRLRFIYALIVSVVVYLVDTTTELGFFLMISRLTSEDFYKIAQESMTMPVISLFLLNLSAACILKKFRLGFSFVPFHINCKDHIHPRFHKAMFFYHEYRSVDHYPNRILHILLEGRNCGHSIVFCAAVDRDHTHFFMKRNCRMTRFKTQMRIFFMIKRMVLKSRLFISQSALRTCCFSSLLFALLSCAQ